MGRNGGLVLYWRASINLTMEGSNRHYIDVVIDKNTENKCRLTGFMVNLIPQEAMKLGIS